MMLIASNGRIVDANASACQLFHYPQEELNGLSVECLVPEDVRSHHSQLREAYYRVPGKRKIGEGRELLGLTKQGKKLTLELIIEQLLLGKDRITLLTAFDVSQRKEAEQNIHLAIDAAASAMIMCDNRRIIRLVNFAAEELFGYSRGELVGQAIDMLIPNEIRHVHSVYVRGFITQQRSRAMGPGSELHAVHKDGSYIPVEIGLKLIDSPVGEMSMPNRTQSGIELVCKTDLAPLVKTDVESLRLILDVLFSNAIRYKDAQKSKPIIKVDVRAARKRLQFVFKDNGTGIAKEHQQKVFDLFHTTFKFDLPYGDVTPEQEDKVA